MWGRGETQVIYAEIRTQTHTSHMDTHTKNINACIQVCVCVYVPMVPSFCTVTRTMPFLVLKRIIIAAGVSGWLDGGRLLTLGRTIHWHQVSTYSYRYYGTMAVEPCASCVVNRRLNSINECQNTPSSLLPISNWDRNTDTRRTTHESNHRQQKNKMSSNAREKKKTRVCRDAVC